MIEIIKVINSAKGIVIQTPFASKKIGKTETPIKTRTNVLNTEISTEILPLEKAVNIEEAKIFIPTVKKLVEKILNPSNVRKNNSLSLPVKILIMLGASAKESPNVKTEAKIMNR